jgi:hypothetical protein
MSEEAQQGLDFDSPLGNEKNSLKFQLTFDREMLDSEVIFPVVGQTFVERPILFGGNLLRVTRPDRLRLVKFLVGNLFLFDSLFLLLLSVLLLVYFLDLGLFTLLFLRFFLVFNLLERVSAIRLTE